MQNNKVVLITGAAKRVGAAIARTLHAHGMRVAIHYRSSANDAIALRDELNQQRPDSAIILQADLVNSDELSKLIQVVIDVWGQLDVLINNASSFYPTPVGDVSDKEWNDLMGSNLKAPFFLAQAAAPYLTKQQGCIVNLVDIYSQQPLKNYSVYSMAKAGLLMLTKSLAKELAPTVRVNAICPGVVLWPDDENVFDQTARDKIIARTLLKRAGTPEEVAQAVYFLAEQATYMTGQMLVLDGGRSLNF